MKFKVGDKVRIIQENWSGPGGTRGMVGVISQRTHGQKEFKVGEAESYLGLYNSDELELISSTNQTTMDIKEKFQLAFKSEPEKSFRKAGVTNGDDYLTDDGQKIFLSWLLKKHGTEFKTEVVDELLKEDKAA